MAHIQHLNDKSRHRISQNNFIWMWRSHLQHQTLFIWSIYLFLHLARGKKWSLHFTEIY